jgi:DNA end-binding protein Ku
MRTTWKGAISFGLVSIPVKAYTATEERDVAFHQVHGTDGGRIRYQRTCTVCGETVAYSDIAKGYELADGSTVIVTDDDLAELPLPTKHTIDVRSFVPADQVDAMFFNRSYYLEPDTAGRKPYALLREALGTSGRAALVKVALRSREQLALVRAHGEALVLETMLWPDEVRSTEALELPGDDVELRDDERAMAASLVAAMSDDFHPETYTDDYREALLAVIDAKVAGREIVAPEPAQEAGGVIDLMAALQASVDAARQARESA